MFEIGQHVVCVDDRKDAYIPPGFNGIGNLDGLTKGIVYTVRSFVDSPVGDLCLRLEEIVRPILTTGGWWNGGEPGFDARRFRPLRRLTVDEFLMEEA